MEQKPYPSKRIQEMCKMRFEGYTLEEIGLRFGLTRQRIHKMIDVDELRKRYNMDFLKEEETEEAE